MANNVDPDRTPHSAVSDPGLHCLLRTVCPIFRIIALFLFPFKAVKGYFGIEQDMAKPAGTKTILTELLPLKVYQM